jgi:hypothetical protein
MSADRADPRAVGLESNLMHGSYTMGMSARQMFADMLSGYRKLAD